MSKIFFQVRPQPNTIHKITTLSPTDKAHIIKATLRTHLPFPFTPPQQHMSSTSSPAQTTRQSRFQEHMSMSLANGHQPRTQKRLLDTGFDDFVPKEKLSTMAKEDAKAMAEQEQKTKVKVKAAAKKIKNVARSFMGSAKK